MKIDVVGRGKPWPAFDPTSNRATKGGIVKSVMELGGRPDRPNAGPRSPR